MKLKTILACTSVAFILSGVGVAEANLFSPPSPLEVNGVINNEVHETLMLDNSASWIDGVENFRYPNSLDAQVETTPWTAKQLPKEADQDVSGAYEYVVPLGNPHAGEGCIVSYQVDGYTGLFTKLSSTPILADQKIACTAPHVEPNTDGTPGGTIYFSINPSA